MNNKVPIITLCLLLTFIICSSWGFYAHRYINEMAIYTLPKTLYKFYSQNSQYIIDHSTDPDKRRGLIKNESQKHFIDLDNYYKPNLQHPPFTWQEVNEIYPEEIINENGTLPWNLLNYLKRLTQAFKEKNKQKILKLSADLGHYISDACVPLHTTSNYNGQLTGQEGIHGLWESRIPELFTNTYNIKVNRAKYISDPYNYIWSTIFSSFKLVDEVLKKEKQLNDNFDLDKKYSVEKRGKRIILNFSKDYSYAYDTIMNQMVKKRMSASIEALGSLWLTAWVNAGQPELDF
ncbi:MAG: zinc dependent phospholipase C family protein [Solitalea-like symbiont of Tyrophagus putrescentiae]